MNDHDLSALSVVISNLHWRYSGVTATNRAVAPLVVVFTEDTPLNLIERIEGGDYPEEAVGREVVETAAGSVLLVDLLAGHSTSRFVDRSLRR